MHQHTDAEMAACIEACLACYRTCTDMAMNHCLALGGAHVEKTHFTLMMACAEVCRTSAHLMLMGSPQHKLTCRACADICRLCADDCERLGDMDDCVTACRECATSCEHMAA